jgi:hypothetical protein
MRRLPPTLFSNAQDVEVALVMEVEKRPLVIRTRNRRWHRGRRRRQLLELPQCGPQAGVLQSLRRQILLLKAKKCLGPRSAAAL